MMAPMLLEPLTVEQEEILDWWADALEFGHYEQGSSMMVKINPVSGQRQHCCLGVFCDVLASRNLLPEGWEWDGECLIEMSTGNAWSAVPPDLVMHVVFGSNVGQGAFGRSSIADRFARANDSWGFSFAQIAAEIRSRNFFSGLTG